MINDDLEAYMKMVFSNELIDIINHSFELYEMFQLPDYETTFTDLLMMSDNTTPDNTRDRFLIAINDKLDFIINEHKMTLISDVSISQKNEVLDALYLIQDLASYKDMLNILEADLGVEEKLAEVLSELCTLTSLDILSIVDSIEPELLNNLKDFAYTRESMLASVKPISDNDKIIINKLRLFKEFSGEYIALGVFLVSNNILIGLSLTEYIKYVVEAFKDKTNKDLAYHIYSLMLLTKDYHENPLLGFKEHGDLFFNDLNHIALVDVELNKLHAEFDKFLINKKMIGS